MAAKKTESKFSIQVDSNAANVAAGAKASVEGLASTIKNSQERIKDLASSLRNLRGSTDEVVNAKEGIKAALDAERNKISQSEIGLRKLGTTTADLAAKERILAKAKAEKEKAEKAAADKKAAANTKGMTEALKNAGGPVASLRDKFESLKAVLGGGGKAGVALGLASVATLAVAGVAAVGMLASKIGELVLDAAKFVLVSANMARTAQLNREAFLGNARDATALGSQIDRLARRIPATKAELNALAQSLSESGLSGRALVDSLEAVAGAGGGALQGKLKAILEAGKLTRRIAINRQDLIGTGIKFDDVAAELAKSMKIGVDAARRALANGTVGIGVGAEALKNVVNKRFGEINARKLLDLDVQAAKFKERLAGLASGVKLEPLLKALDSFAELLDESTVTGAALKELTTAFGDEVAGGLKAGVPLARQFFKGAVLGALELGTAYYTLKRGIKDTFGGKSVDNAKAMTVALGVGKATVLGMVVGLTALAGILAVAAAGAYTMAQPVLYLWDTFDNFARGLKKLGFKGLAKAVVEGFVSGIVNGYSSVRDALIGMGETAKTALKKTLGIASPSKFARGAAHNTADGYVLGIEDKEGEVGAAMARMGSQPFGTPSRGRAGGALAGGAPVEVHVHIHANGGSAQEIVAAVTSPSVIGQLTRAVEDALVGGAMLAGAA